MPKKMPSLHPDPLDPRAFKVAVLIRAARGQTKQAEFGRALGNFSQSQISKYEKGEVDPPAAVIERCMAIVAESRARPSPELETDLLHQVERVVATPELNQIALGLSLILAALRQHMPTTER
jgi:transcriptional regulator with XRE-family HTH domain